VVEPEVLIIALYIFSFIIGMRCQHDTYGTCREIELMRPYPRRYMQAVERPVKVKSLLLPPVVSLHFEAAAAGNDELMTLTVGMSASGLPGRNIINPECTTDPEWQFLNPVGN